MLSQKTYQKQYKIDWKRFPAAVFESDDWGACESASTKEVAGKIAGLYKKLLDYDYLPNTTLETPAQLERLFQALEKFKGADGMSAVFTAFVCTGNPNFKKIRANGYSKYEDIGLNTGVPEGWERGNIIGKFQEGIKRGVFQPEFHSTLHHTSPYLWLQLLREDSAQGKLARALFDCGCYAQREHLPEFTDMNVKMQNEWVTKGLERFKKLFGFSPEAAVTSDAFPETEIIWAINGIKTVCLKNCRINSGQTVAYETKPWNMQDIYTHLGDYNQNYDVTYMTRNAIFEAGMVPGVEHSAEDVLAVAKRNIETFNEPSIISTHRINYASLDEEMIERRLNELEKLLCGLTKMNVNFLTTGEISQIYRYGWSVRHAGNKTVIRKFHDNAMCDNSLLQKAGVSCGELSKLELGTHIKSI